MITESIAASAAAGAVAGDRESLATTFDGFLQLLTTQLQNQDPLSPMDAETFTQQLVQFSQVEQAIKTNENLGDLTGLLRGQQAAAATGYLGAVIDAGGAAADLAEGAPATFRYGLPDGAERVELAVLDEGGEVMFKALGPSEPGNHAFTWDGSLDGGGRAPDGRYRLAITATDARGAPVAASTGLSGVVEAVELSGDALLLAVGGSLVPLADVTAVRRPTT